MRCRTIPRPPIRWVWILYHKHQYPRAATLLQESADKLPTVADIQFHLGMTHYMLVRRDRRAPPWSERCN